MHGKYVVSRSDLRKHFWPWVVFTMASTPTFFLGLGVLYLEVSRLGQNKVAMSWTNVLPLAVLTFAVNRRLPEWKNRQNESGRRRWVAYSLAKVGTSQLLFGILAVVVGLPYLPVSAGTTVSAGIISYVFNHKVVFPQQEATTA